MMDMDTTKRRIRQSVEYKQAAAIPASLSGAIGVLIVGTFHHVFHVDVEPELALSGGVVLSYILGRFFGPLKEDT